MPGGTRKRVLVPGKDRAKRGAAEPVAEDVPAEADTPDPQPVISLPVPEPSLRNKPMVVVGASKMVPPRR